MLHQGFNFNTFNLTASATIVLHKKIQGKMLIHYLLYHSTFVATHNAAIAGCKMRSFRESFLQRGLYS